MYIKTDEQLRSIHRHIKTAKDVELTKKEANELRETIKNAKDEELVIGAVFNGLRIVARTNTYKEGSITTTVGLDEATTQLV